MTRKVAPKISRLALITIALFAFSTVASAATCDRACLLEPKPWGPATETRIALVDPERGIVIGYSILQFPNGREIQINEVFKILDGRIRLIDNIGLMEEGVTTSGFTD